MQEGTYNLIEALEDRLSLLETRLNTLISNPNIELVLQGGLNVTESSVGILSLGSLYYIAGAPHGLRTTGGAFGPQDDLHALPFLLREPRNVTHVRINIAGFVSTTKIRIGVYDVGDINTLHPGRLLAELGEFTVTSTGDKTMTLAEPARLPRGLSWIAMLCDAGSVTMMGIQPSDRWSLLGHGGGLSAGNGWLKQPHAYGALPESFPASAIVIINPAIGLRFKSESS